MEDEEYEEEDEEEEMTLRRMNLFFPWTNPFRPRKLQEEKKEEEEEEEEEEMEEEAKSQLEGPPVGPPGRDGPQAQVVFTGPKPKLPPLGRQLESWFGLG